MSHAKNKVEWCLKKAEKELQEKGKHRGLVHVEPNTKKAEEHLIKAEHNLIVTLHLKHVRICHSRSSRVANSDHAQEPLVTHHVISL